jgi:glycosyltransferase involved in cell wall biosynthesis
MTTPCILDEQSSEPSLPVLWPPVTAVLPAYNLERQLDSTLKALYACGYPTLEVIVVDDGSKDRTVEIAERYPVRLIRHSTNMGAAVARNTGVHAASHDIIYLLDADCIVQPGTLEKLVQRLLSDPKLGVVSGSYLADKSEKNLANQVYDIAERFRDYKIKPKTYAYTTISNAVIRKSVFESVGGFKAEWRRIQDYELTFRIHQAGFLNLHDPSIAVIHNNHRTNLKDYYHHIFLIAQFGTLFRLRNRPAAPFSRYLLPNFTLYVLFSPIYFLLFTWKIIWENLILGRGLQLLAVLPFVLWSRVIYTLGSIKGCYEYNREKKLKAEIPVVTKISTELKTSLSERVA